MSAEITYGNKLQAAKNGKTIVNATQSSTHDMAGDDMTSGTQALTTSHVTLDVGAVDTANDFHLHVRVPSTWGGATVTSTYRAYVSFDGGTTDHLVIYAGKSAGPFRVKGATSVKVKADATYPAPAVEFDACEA